MAVQRLVHGVATNNLILVGCSPFVISSHGHDSVGIVPWVRIGIRADLVF